MTQSAAKLSVSEYWDKFVGTHLNSPDHWEANQVTQQFQWRLICGDPFKNPVDWFMEEYGPFNRMASICAGSGILERHVSASYCQNSDALIEGYDISPKSIELGRGLITRSQPKADGCELDEGKVVYSKPVVARRDPTALFDPVEEPFDVIASAIEVRTKADRITAVAFWGDIGPRTLLHRKLSDPVGVIATVGKQH